MATPDSKRRRVTGPSTPSTTEPLGSTPVIITTTTSPTSAMEDGDGDDIVGEPHPNGVGPMGNWMARSEHVPTDGAPYCDKAAGLGTLSALGDDLVLAVLKCLPAQDLCRLAGCSRALYIFGTHGPLWRTLVLARHNDSLRNGHFVYQRNWQQTYAHGCSAPARFLPTVPLRFSGFYSDAIYNPWLFGTLKMQPSWLEGRPIDRRTGLSTGEFVTQYEHASRPVVITDVVSKWPAFGKWDREYLARAYGGNTCKAAGRSMLVEHFFRYCDAERDERPLYLFDSNFAVTAPELGADYSPPDYFDDDFLGYLSGPQVERPDYRWLIMGPARSGSSFHVDPNGTCAWNAVLKGRKKWILYPPDQTPPGIDDDGSSFRTKTSLMEWFLEHYDSIKEQPEEDRPMECVTGPGDLMFVPSGWWHAVINVEESIAITHNVVTEQNVLKSLEVLKIPSACDPSACQGDAMGDVPLWVAMGGSAIRPPPDAAIRPPPDASLPADNYGDADAAQIWNAQTTDTAPMHSTQTDADEACEASAKAEAPAEAEVSDARMCRCEFIRKGMVHRLETRLEENRPGLLAKLRQRRRAEEERQAAPSGLWATMKAPADSVDSGFSFGFGSS